jgi:hypothetical protein
MKYEFEVEYRPGTQIPHADALSRIVINSCQLQEFRDSDKLPYVPILDREHILEEQLQDATLKKIISNLSDNESLNNDYFLDDEGLLYRKLDGYTVLVMPTKLRRQIIYNYHNVPCLGHMGLHKCYHALRQRFYWAGMYNMVKQYVKNCRACQTRKPRKNPPAPLCKFNNAEFPLNRVSLDIMGPYKITERNNRYILCMQDHMTRYPEAVCIPDQKAETVARYFVSEFVCRHGIMRNLLSDLGTNFISNLFKETCKILQINRLLTSGWRPECNGQQERSHGTISQVISFFISDSHLDWDLWLPFALFAFRTTVHRTTKHTPYFLMHGRECEIPFESIIHANRAPMYRIDPYYPDEMKSRLQLAFQKVREISEIETDRTHRQFNKNAIVSDLKVGDTVDLKIEQFASGKKKFGKRWQGPYEITQQKSDVNFRIRHTITGKRKMVHVNRLRRVDLDSDPVLREVETTSRVEMSPSHAGDVSGQQFHNLDGASASLLDLSMEDLPSGGPELSDSPEVINNNSFLRSTQDESDHPENSSRHNQIEIENETTPVTVSNRYNLRPRNNNPNYKQ